MSTTVEETPQSIELAKRAAKPKKYKEPAYRKKGSSDFLKPTLGGLIDRRRRPGIRHPDAHADALLSPAGRC